MIKYLFISALILSCQEDPIYKMSEGIPVIEGVSAELNDVVAQEWKVGDEKSKTVSFGARFDIRLKSLDEDVAQLVFDKHGADAWLFKVNHIADNGYNNYLGSFFIQFMGNYKGKVRYQNVKFANFKVFYAAAAMSEEFRTFRCPAFNHRKVIAGIEFESNPDGNKPLYIVSGGKKYEAKTDKIFLVPPMYNGGNSLGGRFEIIYALYNSAKRRVVSTWSRIDQVALITKENLVKIPECAGVKEELEPRKEREFNFKFGQ